VGADVHHRGPFGNDVIAEKYSMVTSSDIQAFQRDGTVRLRSSARRNLCGGRLESSPTRRRRYRDPLGPMVDRAPFQIVRLERAEGALDVRDCRVVANRIGR
jgi:hypothetical protein